MEGLYSKIFKQAYYLTKGHKFFRLAGLFLVWPVLIKSFFVVLVAGNWLNYEPISQAGTETAPQGNPWFGLFSLLVIGIFVFYYFRNKGGTIAAVKELKTKTSVDSKTAYESAAPATTNLLKTGFAFTALVLFLTAVVGSPVMYLANHNYSGRAFTLGVLAIAVYLPIFAVVYLAGVLVPLYTVILNLTARDSLRASFDLVRKYGVGMAVFGLILLLIELVWLLASIGFMIISWLPFVVLVWIFYDIRGLEMPVLIQGLAGTVGFMVFFMSQAAFAAYRQVAWTVMFLEIIKPAKPDVQEEAVTVPEVAS